MPLVLSLSTFLERREREREEGLVSAFTLLCLFPHMNSVEGNLNTRLGILDKDRSLSLFSAVGLLLFPSSLSCPEYMSGNQSGI